MVELAKIMEMVLDVVKRHSSHSSEIFWRDVGDLGTMLFGERYAKKRQHLHTTRGIISQTTACSPIHPHGQEGVRLEALLV